MVGDGLGPAYFAIDEKSGSIRLRSGVDLVRDDEITYTVMTSLRGPSMIGGF